LRIKYLCERTNNYSGLFCGKRRGTKKYLSNNHYFSLIAEQVILYSEQFESKDVFPKSTESKISRVGQKVFGKDKTSIII
jgi:hypothetical protein